MQGKGSSVRPKATLGRAVVSEGAWAEAIGTGVHNRRKWGVTGTGAPVGAGGLNLNQVFLKHLRDLTTTLAKRSSS